LRVKLKNLIVSAQKRPIEQRWVVGRTNDDAIGRILFFHELEKRIENPPHLRHVVHR
jgi:hypothetical protein